MAALYAGDVSQAKTEESGGCWYFSRKEIEENSSSRRDGVGLKKETYLRKSYCTFLRDLGKRLKVPQVTIATAMVFCHRFFLRQSHVKNDRRTIATVCMFLVGKVEETPRPLKDVILVSYGMIHKKDPTAVQRIKQKEVYEQQKELILLGERVVLTTLGFDLNLLHPYRPLVQAIKRFQVAQNALVQVSWNFVNDGLWTSICLQFKPQQIAAGAIFLAAKFLKVKLPLDGEKVWWQEFDVTPRQLEDVSNQILELYEQTRPAPSQASEAEGSAGGNRPPSKAPLSEEHVASHSNSSKPGTLGPVSDQRHANNHNRQPQMNETKNNNLGSANMNVEMNSILDRKQDEEIDDAYSHEREALPHEGNTAEIQTTSGSGLDGGNGYNGNVGITERRNSLDPQDKYHSRNPGAKNGMVAQSPHTSYQDELGDLHYQATKGKSLQGEKFDSVEEGELKPFDDVNQGYQSPKSNNRKRKAASPPDKYVEVKHRNGYALISHNHD